MKNRFIALLLCMSIAGTAMGCGAKGNDDRYVNSGCDFSCGYIDVTFDGHEDIVISLGAAGNCLVHCAYVYDNGEFVEK